MARKAYLARQARLKALRRKKVEAIRKKKGVEELESQEKEEEVDDYNDDIDFDYGIFGTPRDEVWDSESDDNEDNIPTIDGTSE